MCQFITYRDNLGEVVVEVDEYGVQFINGKAIFTSPDGRIYRVPVDFVECICRAYDD